MTVRGTWKALERKHAGDHGCTRIPVTGREGPDWENALFCGQSKLRKGRPKQVDEWLDKITAQAKDKGKVGLVVWCTPREDRSRGVVLLRYDDWVSLHGSSG